MQKQSVENVERLFSNSLITWMEKSYASKAEYLLVVHNWRKTWGISDPPLSQYNQDYLLDNLMPHYKECKDLSLLEVNRYILTVTFDSHK